MGDNENHSQLMSSTFVLFGAYCDSFAITVENENENRSQLWGIKKPRHFYLGLRFVFFRKLALLALESCGL